MVYFSLLNFLTESLKHRSSHTENIHATDESNLYTEKKNYFLHSSFFLFYSSFSLLKGTSWVLIAAVR